MGSLFRSEDMTYVRLYFDNVAAHSTIKELGREEIIQLEDLNSHVSAFQRAHAADVRRCEEMLRKLRYLREQADREALADPEDVHPGSAGVFSEVTPKLGDLDVFLGGLEESVQEIDRHDTYMRERYREMSELQSVLETCLEVFSPTSRRGPGTRIVESIARGVARVPVAGEAGADALRSLSEQSYVKDPRNRLVAFVAGVLDTERRAAFEKLVFRATRGNSLIRTRDVDEGRTVFVIFFAGERARQKTERICTALQGSLYPVPEKTAEQLDK